MKELKVLIEAAKTYKQACIDHTNIDEDCIMPVCLKLERLESAISAAEAALKRAKAFEGELDFTKEGLILVIERCESGATISQTLVPSILNYRGKKVTIIVIPKEADHAGK